MTIAQSGSMPRTTRAEPRRVLDAEWLGSVTYPDALQLQAQLVSQRRAGNIQDRLLLLEHPHVITLGTSAHSEHVLVDAEQRALLGIELHSTGRGGDVTYHGPGQLVGYPILDLKPDRCDVHAYLRDIEEALIRTLGDFEITAARAPGRTGVWVGDDKIAAIGVRVSSGWITSHGFALNVATNLAYFDAIVPCGMRAYGVTSIERERACQVPMQDVCASVAGHFAQTFRRSLNWCSANTTRKT